MKKIFLLNIFLHFSGMLLFLDTQEQVKDFNFIDLQWIAGHRQMATDSARLEELRTEPGGELYRV
ncbi:MAG: hypothetical protein EH225_01065 [Calditrichaeota bacterium]|nr:hypothetical protein [Calditrichota bacterium]RQW07798.1 MAG: hypothetical protein EH225_01065 [Calditrichota bacterium]